MPALPGDPHITLFLERSQLSESDSGLPLQLYQSVGGSLGKRRRSGYWCSQRAIEDRVCPEIERITPGRDLTTRDLTTRDMAPGVVGASDQRACLNVSKSDV